MPITLVTGLPGHGKTLYSLVRWKREAEQAGRPVFHSWGDSADGIPGLSLNWQAWNPREWFKLPAGALMVLDECQRVFPIRGRGAEVPEHVRQLETHRHLGLDLVLITQDPMLIDPHVRRLVDRHLHIVRKFGTSFATVHEYVNGVREQVAKSRGDSIRHEWRFPSEAFAWYTSAELHTVKRRVPARVFALALLPFAALGLAWSFWGGSVERMEGQAGEGQAVPVASEPAPVAAPPGATVVGAMPQPLTPAEWAQLQRPRVVGLPHTAPAYDEVTRPAVAPYPAACVANRFRCLCYTQQATLIDTPETLCRGIVAGGFFVSWTQPAAEAPQKALAAPTPADPPAPGGAVSLGGSRPPAAAASSSAT